MVKMGKKPKKYTREFKEQAVVLALELGCVDASLRLGMPLSTLVTWQNKSMTIGGFGVNKKSDKIDYEIEYKRAQKEISELKKINIILKSEATWNH